MRMLLLVVAVFLGVLSSPAIADPFGSPTAPSGAAPAAEAGGASMMGGFVQRLSHEQMKLNQRLSHEFRLVRDTGSAAAMATILALAFLYGILHAAGPGHGKSVVASYFVANEARWTSGVVMGGVISLLQGVTAIAIVFLLSLALHAQQLQVKDRGALIEFVSYGLVAAIGVVMFWRAVTGRGCGHTHGPAGHDHHHDHAHGEACSHDHDHSHAHHQTSGVNFGRILTAAAGVAPCASAIIIMLFALANDAMTVGVAAVLSLSLGMGLTVSIIGVLSIVGRRFLMRLTGTGFRAERIERALAVAGSLAVMGFSGLLMLGAWDQL
jgi:nickel/cobalt exporter